MQKEKGSSKWTQFIGLAVVIIIVGFIASQWWEKRASIRSIQNQWKTVSFETVLPIPSGENAEKLAAHWLKVHQLRKDWHKAVLEHNLAPTDIDKDFWEESLNSAYSRASLALVEALLDGVRNPPSSPMVNSLGINLHDRSITLCAIDDLIQETRIDPLRLNLSEDEAQLLTACDPARSIF